MSGPLFRILCLFLGMSLAWAESFSGTVTAIEVLRGPEESSDREEFDRLASVVEGRIRQHRESLVTARPLAARILRDDLGFLQAEQERIVLRGGGDLTIGTLQFTLHQGRLLQVGDDVRLQIDRNRNLALTEIAGTIRPVTLAPLPPPVADPGKPGPSYLGRPTVQRRLTINGREATVLAMAGLPNPWALGLIDGAADNDLFIALATIPGLPVQVTWDDSGLTRELRVTAIVPGPVDERLFVPWTVTDP